MGNELTAPNQWSDTDIELALRTMALTGGSPTKTAALMEQEGRPIPATTLTTWRDTTHAVRYENIVDQVRGEISKRVANRAMHIAGEAAQVEAGLVERAGDTIRELDAKDLTKAALNMAQLKKQNVETARVLREQPTQIVATQDVGDALARLQALGVLNVEAQEIE